MLTWLEKDFRTWLRAMLQRLRIQQIKKDFRGLEVLLPGVLLYVGGIGLPFLCSFEYETPLCSLLLFFGEFLCAIWASEKALDTLREDNSKRRYLWYAHPTTTLGIFEAGRQAKDKDLDNLLKPDCLGILRERADKFVKEKLDGLKIIVDGMKEKLDQA